MVIKGGLQGQPGNPHDPSDEGVFISKINEGGCIFKEYSDKLKVFTSYYQTVVLILRITHGYLILIGRYLSYS